MPPVYPKFSSNLNANLLWIKIVQNPGNEMLQDAMDYTGKGSVHRGQPEAQLEIRDGDLIFKRKLLESQNLITNKKDIELCIHRLILDGCLSPEKGALIKDNLPTTISQSKYILFNLGVHISIGAVFAYDIIPLPVGTVSRFLWVLGNRIFWAFKRDREKKRIHSFQVLLFSLIPFVGYFAYTLPLKKYNEDLAYVFANQITYLRKEVSLVKYLEGKPRIISWALKKLLIPEDINKVKKANN